MEERKTSRILAAVDAFVEARRMVRTELGAASAADLVARVVQGRLARSGELGNGVEYMVHGVGYTLTMLSGGQIHIDACSTSEDCFKVYDVRFYLEDLEDEDFPVAAIAEACEVYIGRNGSLRRADAVTFAFTESA